MPLGKLLVRGARFAAPIAVACAIVWAPLGHVAFHVPPPTNAAQAKVAIRLAWVVAACSLPLLLLLVGAIAPALRAARGERQLHVLRAVLGGLASAVVPTLAVLLAVTIGGLALAVPGVLLLLLFVLAPASTAHGVTARLADAAALARTQLRTLALIVGLALVLIAAAVLVHQLLLPMPLPKKPTPAQLALFPALARTAAIAVAVVVPVAAALLAAVHVRATSESP